MPFSLDSFFGELDSNPLLAKQMLIDAVAAADITFPSGTSTQSLLDYIWDSAWFFPVSETGCAKSELLQQLYGAYQRPEGVEPPLLEAFPLDSVLDLLDRMAAGAPEAFSAFVWDWLRDLMDPEVSQLQNWIAYSSPQ